MTTQTGSCHCGKVKFEVKDLPREALDCNCSVCLRRGSLLSFVPATSVKMISGENELSEYLFGKKSIHHMFCKTCGIFPFGKAEMPNDKQLGYAINVRVLDDVDLSQFKISTFDGKHKL